MNRVFETLFPVYNKKYAKKYIMAEDILGKFYTCLNLPLESKLIELTKLIDQASPTKELQALFPQLISNIFSTSFGYSWNLKTVTSDYSRGKRQEFEILTSFLEPQGPIFRLCYKLMSDQQLKYDLPLNLLPLDLQMSLERGRCPQFYLDMLVVDSQTMNFVALALNPFDYYIFNFAMHLVNNSQQQMTWENWNSVYFTLACDYLMHFLPSDPNVPVLPLISNYTGKVAITTSLQTASRPHTPSLLLMPDVCGLNNQHAPQSQSRNEVWRSETVLQVFVDIWMIVEQFNPRDVDLYQRAYQSMCSTPERVRTVRVLVKHIHSYASKHLTDTAARSSALRKYARQIMCARAYHYVKHLVQTWPLDASFRLVLELWLSLIQPWRYADNNINQDRFPGHNNNQEEANVGVFDSSYMQFIAENFPSYTCIFQLVMPRFMRMDLTAYKNAVMLFRVGKVFSQQHLVPILWNLEQAITESNATIFHSHDSSYMPTFDQSHIYNGVSLHKWVAVAKQAVLELNMATATFEYDPVWSDNNAQLAHEFLRKIYLAKVSAENIAGEYSKRVGQQHKGIIGNIKSWLMIEDTSEEHLLLEECKKVPSYLNNSIHYFINIFGLSESSLVPPEQLVGDSMLENSSFTNSTNFPLTITNKLRSKPTTVHYMGDPDLMPIASYESTILVRMLYQIASKINDLYQEEFSSLYSKDNLSGFIAREVLEGPCTVRSYAKAAATHQHLVTQELSPRLSLRKLGSHAFLVWLTIGYILFRMLSYSGFTYIFFLITFWIVVVFTKASLKMCNLLKS